MKVQYFSDLHLEFFKTARGLNTIFDKWEVTGEILCLAGDIGIPYEPLYEVFLKKMSELYKKVFIIAGNHEYYSKHTVKETKKKIREVVWPLPNITFLDNEYEDYNGVRWIGSTLWSDIDTYDPKFSINDLKFITRNEYTGMYIESKNYLSNAISESPLKVVVITHHAPSLQLISEQWKGSKWNDWFASDCDHLIQEPILFWIFGHTHDAIEHEINGVKCICNPIGYPGENVPDFTKTIEVGICSPTTH